MPTTRQGISSAKIEQIVAQRVTNVIEAIAIYEIKIRVAHDSAVRDVRLPFLPQLKRAPLANQKTVVTCYECGKQRHYMSECSKLKNYNFGNQKGNKGKARGNPNVIKDHANALGEIFPALPSGT
ncbi:reverse transcriptase domain-containing protein [Tanacetum coccineum]